MRPPRGRPLFGAASSPPAAGLLGDPLHVGGLAHQPAQSGEAAALDADLLEHLVDHRRLHAIAQRRLDHLVGRAAAGAAAPAAAAEPVHLQDADRLDLLHRLDALAHDALDAVEQAAAEQAVARPVGEDVLGLVQELLRLRLDGGAHLLGLRGDPLLLGRLLGQQHLDALAALGLLALAHGGDVLLGLRGARARGFRLDLGGRLLERFVVEHDRLLHRGELDRLLALDLEPAQVALAPDARLVDAAIGGDARPLDLLARRDLRLLQRLLARATSSCSMARRRSSRAASSAWSRPTSDTSTPWRAVDLALLGRLLGGDALGGELLLLRDARGLDRLARRDLGGVDRPVAGDLQRADRLVAGDALRRHPALLGDARRLHLVARGDLRVSIASLRAISRPRVSCSEAMRSAASRFSWAMRAASTASCAAISASSTARLRAISSARTRCSWAMRAVSVASRAAISASSIALRRSISRRRVSSSLAMRASVTAFSWAMRRFSVSSRTAMSACSTARVRSISRRCVSSSRAMRASVSACSWAMRAFSIASRAAISASSTVLSRSISRWRMSRSEAMRASLMARSLAMRDLLDLLAGGDLRLLGLGLAQGALARHLGTLQRAALLDVALLLEPRGLALPLDVERLLLGLEVARADADHRVLLDVVAQLAALLDLLDQLGQAFGIEPVRRVEELQVGLVEIGDGDAIPARGRSGRAPRRRRPSPA